MNEIVKLGIWTAVICVAFFVAWRNGYLLRLGGYFSETREELRKCTWPTRAELKNSTAVVMISIAMIGLFTVASDFIFSWLLPLLSSSK